jgi:hypothetical protein
MFVITKHPALNFTEKTFPPEGEKTSVSRPIIKITKVGEIKPP